MAAARIRIDPASKRALFATFSAEEGPQRVLIVDHDVKARALLEARLLAQGYEVAIAGSAREALKAIGPGRPLPSIVVAEADLPGDDGFELCARIRADARTAFLPVVLLSANDEHDASRRAGAAGADDHLLRPVYVGDIVSLVRLLSSKHTVDADVVVDSAAVPLHKMVRALISGMRAGKITVGKLGQLTFAAGRIIDARLGACGGEAALRRLLYFAQGEYQVSFGSAVARADFSVGLEAYCTRIEPQVLRWRELAARCLPMDALLAVDFAALTEQLHLLPDDVNGLVRLFDGRRTLRDVLLESPFSEGTTLEASTRLYTLGVLSPVFGAQELEAPKAAPPLFDGPVTPAQLADSLFGEDPPAQPPAPSPASWTGEALVDRMDPALQAQLDALGVRTVTEPWRPQQHHPSLEAFAAGVELELEDTPTLTAAISAAVDAPVEAPADEPQAESIADEETTAVTEAPKATRTGVPARIALGTFAITASVVLVAVAVSMIVGRAKVTDAGAAAAPPVKKVKQAPVAMPALAVKADGPSLAQGVAFYEAGLVQDSVALLEQVVLREPDPSAWLMLGVARFDAGDLDGAEIAARRALELDGSSGRALMLLASVYIELGEHAKADSRLQRYLELEPHGQFADEARELLERTRVPANMLKAR